MQKMTLQAQPRMIVGRQVKSLRKAGLVPAVVYGHGFEPLSIQVPVKDFERVYNEAGESTVVYLKVNDQEHPTIIHDVARDAVSDAYLHADFYKVRLDEKIHAQIELEFIGEAPAVKNFGGILVKNMSEIEVEGLPQDLPHNIEVNLAGLSELNSHIAVKDLAVSDKLKVKADPETVVVLVQEPISEEELKAQFEEVAGAAEDVEVIKKEKEIAETQNEEEAQKEPEIKK